MSSSVSVADLVVSTASKKLNTEALVLTGEIQARFYSRHSNKSLGRRTGQAVRGWQVLKQGDNAYSIINNVPHADQSVQRTIVPTKSKYLAIPVGPALTKAGVSRFTGPRDSNAPKFRVARSTVSSDTLVLIGKKRGNVRKEEIFFVLKKSVVIPPRTRGVLPYVKKKGFVIGERIARELTSVVDRLVTSSFDPTVGGTKQ